MAIESGVTKADQNLLLELISDRLGELQGVLENYLQKKLEEMNLVLVDQERNTNNVMVIKFQK